MSLKDLTDCTAFLKHSEKKEFLLLQSKIELPCGTGTAASPERPKPKQSWTEYYCRGCGEALGTNSSQYFHAKCLAADKRRRTQRKRESERRQFRDWLKKQRCGACGAIMN